jgi:hypothetical protein
MTYKVDPFNVLMGDERHWVLGKALKAANKRIVDLEKALAKIRDFEPDRQAWSVNIARAALEGDNKDE